MKPNAGGGSNLYLWQHSVEAIALNIFVVHSTSSSQVTKNSKLSDSNGDLTCRIPLEYYFSEVAVSFFENLHSNRKVMNCSQKRPLVATKTRVAAAPS